MILKPYEAITLWVAFVSFGATKRDVCGHILVSATDLMGFTGCADASKLNLLGSRGIGSKPHEYIAHALCDPLPNRKRIGKIGSFQRKDVASHLAFFTTEPAKETSFGMEFQFSLRRNVVVSRSRGLLLVFGAPHLRKAKRDMVQQIWLANSLFLSSRFLEPST